MKIRTLEASRNLEIHPAHFLLHVTNLDKSLTFEDVWPEIEQHWVETISVAGGHRHTHSVGEKEIVPSVRIPVSSVGLSNAALRIVDKLRRHGNWGNAYITFDGLLRQTHLSSHEVDNAIAELRKMGFLDHDRSGRGGISLNSARRKEIESIP
ncbi:MAG: hypothetical protein ABSH06_15555 [Thermodesulfobacteriota bacterium]|jgi:hypothetical protein